MIVILADITSRTNNGRRAGHYLALADNYMELFGDKCKIAGGPVYEGSFEKEKLIKLPYSPESGDKLDKLKIILNARSLFKQAKGNIIVLQQCSSITSLLCIALFYNNDSKLFLIQYSHEAFRMRLGKWLYKFAKNKINGIICPNRQIGDVYGLPYCVVPDYILSSGKIEEKKILSFDNKIYDLCILGRIAPGKGCVESAGYLANTKYKVLIAGSPSSIEIKDRVLTACKNADNIDLKLKYISKDEYDLLLSKSRFALLNYGEEYSKRSSGVVFDMIFSGIPVIGARCSALEFVEKEKIGYLYDNINELNSFDIYSREKYVILMNNIQLYCKKHLNYKIKLISFLFGNHDFQ